MLHLLIYAASGYLVVGAVIYLWGHPRRERAVAPINAQGAEGRSNLIYRQLAHSVQAVNFLVHSVTAKEHRPAAIADLYEASVRRAFNTKFQFITTGTPHARAFYPRNFAWFYPDLLDPATLIDDEDMQARVVLIERSLHMVLDTMRMRPYTTTIIPLAGKHFATVNYITPPSDSLLGVLAGIEQLADSRNAEARRHAAEIIERYGADIETQLALFAERLRPVVINKRTCLLLDAKGNMSSATDTRNERMRFVVSANVWTTFAKAEKLGFMGGEVFGRFGLEKAAYKKQILELFGRDGYVVNSVAPEVKAKRADNITLDFAHVYKGFWDFSHPDESGLFKNTADLIFSDPTFRDISNNCYFVSNKNPRYHFLHRYTTPAYHGRTVWSSFNVEFADRLMDLATMTGDGSYRERAERILIQLKNATERHGGYPELIDADGAFYRTWIYKSAIADSWFPRFAGVWSRAFGYQVRSTNELSSRSVPARIHARR